MRYTSDSIPANKKILTEADLQYLRESYNNTLNKIICAKLNIAPITLRRILKREGLIRTQEDIDFIKAQQSTNTDAFSRQSIENGSRTNRKATIHKAKWIKHNGRNFTNKFILVYKNAKYDDWKDLVLIFKTSYAKFIQTRQAKFDAIQAKKDKVTARQLIDKRKNDKERKNEERIQLLKDIRERGHSDDYEIAQDKVLVQLNAKTHIWAKREKCILVDGKYQLKNQEKVKRNLGLDIYINI